MARIKFGASSVTQNELGQREKQNKRYKRLITLSLLLGALNLAFSVLNHKDDIKYYYNNMSEKIKKMRN